MCLANGVANGVSIDSKSSAKANLRRSGANGVITRAQSKRVDKPRKDM